VGNHSFTRALGLHGFCLGFKNIPGYSKEAFLYGGHFPGYKVFSRVIQQESTLSIPFYSEKGVFLK
jgi:hypothetical protein